MRKILAWFIAINVLLIRWSCRVVFVNDPRVALRAAKQSYIFAILHGQQLAAIIGREKQTGAMVSRSVDGDLLIPSLTIRGITAFRGSSRTRHQDKGGLQALQQMVQHSKSGKPTYFAVDGPKGPRGKVKRGIADLAVQANAVVLVVIALPSRRWIIKKAWDRFQIPKHFSKVTLTFAEPLKLKENESAVDFRSRIELVLAKIERDLDPAEAALNPIARPAV